MRHKSIENNWFLELDVTVSGTYTPAERQTYDHPGYPAEIEDLRVYLGKLDITDQLNDDQLELAAEQLLEWYID